MAEGGATARSDAGHGWPVRARLSAAWRTRLLTHLQNLTEWPLTFMAAALVPLLAGRLLFDVSATSDLILRELTSLIWAAYTLNLLFAVLIAPDRLAFLRSRRTWLDELMVVLPLLHMLVEGSPIDDLFHVARLAVAVLRVIVGLQRVVRQPGLPYSLLSVCLVILISGIFVPIVERGEPEATIVTLSDGVWWSLETITTVGYGDYYPTTELGKGLAMVLMVIGVTLYGVLAANLAVLLARQSLMDGPDGLTRSAATRTQAAREETLLAKLDAIEQRLVRLEEELARRPEGTADAAAPPGL
jgi:voltage-gated potassium channel